MKMNFKDWLIKEEKGRGLNGYVKNGMVDLYHYTSVAGNSDFYVLDPKKAKPSHYSMREFKTATTPRVFFYLDIVDKEGYFSQDYVFTTSVPRNQICDLSKDEGGLIETTKKQNHGIMNYDLLFENVMKEGYKGVFYDNSMYVVCWFEPIEVRKVKESDVLKELGYEDMAAAKEKERKRKINQMEEERLEFLRKEEEERRKKYGSS